MKSDLPKLRRALRAAKATRIQNIMANMLYQIHGIKCAMGYASGIKRMNAELSGSGAIRSNERLS